MLKVIIADDEKLICRLVKALADWNLLGMEVVGEAAVSYTHLTLPTTSRV